MKSQRRLMNLMHFSGKLQKQLRRSGWSLDVLLCQPWQMTAHAVACNAHRCKSTWSWWKEKNEVKGGHEMTLRLKKEKEEESDAPNQTRFKWNKQWCMAVWTTAETSSPAFHTIMILFQFQPQFHPALSEKEQLMEACGCLCRPAAGFLNHAVVLSDTNLKCKLQAPHFIFFHILEGSDATCAKSCFAFLAASPEHQLHAGCTTGVCDIITYYIPWAALPRAKDFIVCAVMQERSCPSVIVIDAYTFDACIMRKECRQSAVLHICRTSSGSFLISPLHQQVARALREEGQDTQLQDCRECQECKQVVPPRFLQSKHNNSINNLGFR